ncbi:phosphate regulon transcriptional regulatory protein PhoB [Geminocystis sp. NIES-3708]|uniref:response regulator transcription factor n=1 Tax=Geminocystis sp. NIES-3708 TaxID=1615909 RepID=UPI0005FC94F5|nr:response regulator transcription factor [Geminocystis sp. NIES-3708]BAQ60528.1 phosphate regulon transcriptional regulatory protein PhoB [Geminocystis sp. NIES-3708]
MLSLELPSTAVREKIQLSSRILLIEDEELIRNIIALNLEEEGYEVIKACNGREALNILERQHLQSSGDNIDMVILDLMLPEVNGLDVCRLLRHRGNMIPILILSAKAAETDRVLGLEVGADDYLTKPFSMKELVARCRALLRRNSVNTTSSTSIRQFKDITMLSNECRVMVRQEEVNLSPKEYRLLELFMTYPKRVWDREQLIENIWGADFLGDTKTVDVHIRWLREKLEKDPSNPEYLITVRGFGYRFG